MLAKKLTINGVVGGVLTLVAAGFFIWTYSMRLRPMELFVPRIALGLIMLGGVLVILKEFVKPEIGDRLSKAFILPYAIGVSLMMWLYGWAFRNIGLITATAIGLSAWWIWVAVRDARRTKSTKGLTLRIIKLVVLAIVVAVVVQLLFVNLLGMYMPSTLFP